MRKPAQSLQAGTALIVSIVFLLLLSTLALTGLRSSTTNVQIAGNMQARQEVIAAAQMLIEQTVSTDEFARNPAGVFAAARVVTDINGDGEPDATAVLAQPPVCLRARSVALVDLDPTNPVDAPCFASAALTNPGLLPGGGAPAGSLCADTEWQIVARATDNRTGATMTLNQGVTVRTAVVGLNTVCN
ncbi:MAG TPA: PilX N-terminal domain-containing pilus assembly protein [Burkholderiaceae bacterium]|nr:PilX N-terminal domain-containing pilus assembly protein [Burkholderiaceae bacterium]